MTAEQRIIAFQKLGQFLNTISKEDFETLALSARNENPWFTEKNVRLAIDAVCRFLSPSDLQQWLAKYTEPKLPKTVALVTAGNIPLVGFHDVLAVLICGHHVQIKLSSKDSVLMKFMLSKLVDFEPELGNRINTTERLSNFDAVIATGSDNSSRYFEYYFGKYPHIIRKNRTSVAILNGTETRDQLNTLGNDIFNYFGLGCRNVSKLYVPDGYKFDTLFESWETFKDVIHHHKYCNNYDYQKSILLVNSVPFLDNGFVMLQQSDRIVSPISVIYYDFYKDENQLNEKITLVKDKIQVVVGKPPLGTVEFGEAQSPGLCDYADNVDTMQFLSSI